MPNHFNGTGVPYPLDVPRMPKAFTSIPDEFQPGVYILGMDKFTVSNFHIANIFHRQVSSYEEFILGMLSVFLISVVSEIVYTILLRTMNRYVSISGLVSAFYVSEVTHFRNISSAVLGRSRWAAGEKDGVQHGQRVSRRVTVSIVVISIAAFLFAADVLAVVLTQPKVTTSSRNEYNMVAQQPVGFPDSITKFARRIGTDRPCVTPIMTGSTQNRNYLLNVCIMSEKVEDLNDALDVSSEITVGSWFHEAGSDHNITIGDKVFLSFNIRAQILLAKEQGGSRRLLFQSLDNENFDHTRYLHELVLYGAIEWLCREDGKDFKEVQKKQGVFKTCTQLVDELQAGLTSRKVTKEIKLWRGKDDNLIRNISGIVSTARIGMAKPFDALNAGARFMIVSSVVLETDGPGRYSKVSDDSFENGIDGLLSEEGRVAGVLLLSVILLGLVLVMIVLRIVLQPVSLGYVALSKIQEDDDFDLVDRDRFLGVVREVEEEEEAKEEEEAGWA